MKNSLRILSLFCIVALVAVCSLGNTAMPNKITGELISIAPEVTDEANEAEAASTEVPPHEPVDLSSATLTITHETTNAEGEAETVTLYEGAYQENFENVVQMSEPTEVKIALQVSEESEPMTINAVVGNGSDIHFAYVDRPGLRDEFLLVGSANQVMNPENKFSLSGDLSFLDFDLTNTTSAFAYATFVNADGERQSKQWGPVLVKDNSFLIEGDVHRPIQATLYLRNQSSFYSASTRIILEPQGELVVAKLGNQTRELATVSGTGYHAQLIESWQQSEKYISLVDAWTTEYERSQNPPSDPETAPEGSADSDSNEDEADAEDEAESDSEESTEVEESIELVVSVDPAEGCEDAVAAQEAEPAETELATNYEPPYWRSLQMEASSFRLEKLQDIAKNNRDPNAQLLALQMGAFSPYSNAEEALTVWQTLTDMFDEDFVATYITPELERVELVHTRTLNNEALVPGQKVPEFTLASLEGEDVAIYDLMGERDMVLIDFWASWCGPCIATFPDLKKLHAAYTDENFEIVGVSVDDNLDDWSGGVEEHELPWVQLGELKDADNGSPVSKSYGVNFIPSTFLVDSQGCIYRKNIHPDELKTFLVDRYGMDESLVEPEIETEDTPEVSS